MLSKLGILNLQGCKRTKLLLNDCNIIINNNIQETTLLISVLPIDIHEWFGDIAFLLLFLLKTENITEDLISKVNEDITKNEVRRKDHVSKRAFERFNSLFS